MFDSRSGPTRLSGRTSSLSNIIRPSSAPQASGGLAWRPQTLSQYQGQNHLKAILQPEIAAAKKEHRPLPNMLLAGPPGLGKTSLVYVLGEEMGVTPIILTGKDVKLETLAKTLCGLDKEKSVPRDGIDAKGYITNPVLVRPTILALDECEELPRGLFEHLHTVMEPDSSGRRFLTCGGLSTQKRKLTNGREEDYVANEVMPRPVPPLTVILLTNYRGKLRKRADAAVNRCQLKLDFKPYSDDEIRTIVSDYAGVIRTPIDADAVDAIACRALGVPRTARFLFDRVRVQAVAHSSGRISIDVVKRTLEILQIDNAGLSSYANDYLVALVGAPKMTMGLKTISSRIGVDQETVEADIEPALMRKGLVQVVAGGRQLTATGMEHLGITTTRDMLVGGSFN